MRLQEEKKREREREREEYRAVQSVLFQAEETKEVLQNPARTELN